MEQRYYSVNEIAQIFGLKPRMVNDFCHAKGQQHAFQFKAHRKISIDLKAFEKWFRLHYAKEGAR